LSEYFEPLPEMNQKVFAVAAEQKILHRIVRRKTEELSIDLNASLDVFVINKHGQIYVL